MLLTRPRKRPKPRVSVFHCHFLQCRVRAFPVDLLFYYRFLHTKLSRASIKIVPSVMGLKCFRPATKWATVTSSNYGQPTTTPKPPKTSVCCICETLSIEFSLLHLHSQVFFFFSFLFAFSYFRSRVKLLLVRSKHFLVLVKGHKKEGSVITSVRLW